MHLFYQNPIPEENNIISLNEDESRHCLKTLRMSVNDTINLTDGEGSLFTCRIIEVNKTICLLEITDKKQNFNARSFRIHIAAAITKNLSRMEFFIEKAVELGIYSFTPLICQHSERTNFKPDRFLKIAVSAMKQSYNTHLPQINNLQKMTSFLNDISSFKNTQKFLAFQDDKSIHLSKRCTEGKDAIVLIGPEGDFSKDEIEIAIKNDFEIVNLGMNRLRTETAALYACAIINSCNASLLK
ncbi:MAG: RsmE family RNA methyltransferase [Bacteroidales bacterium]|nr:RsmE family RNA methyltransferase [Bacteroidales bacterium]